MGTEITTERFQEGDYVRFRQRLDQNLSELQRLLERPGFGAGPVTIGAELELFLVDGAAAPLPLNQAVRAEAADPRITVELNGFNLELNSSPAPLAGRPFTTLGGELSLLLARAGNAARAHQGRIVLIGILPTLNEAHLDARAVTDVARYRALGRGLLRLRQGPIRIRIAGEDPLELTSEYIALEGANTSFQVHLRVAPPDFTRVYNAVQLATAPALAVAGNSPTFLGHRLWEETRIALFKQAVEDRDRRGPRRRPSRTAFGSGWVRDGALELFADSVRLHEPLLPYITGGEGDPPRLDEHTLPFERAEHGFYRAAQYGLAAELSWPTGRGDQVKTLSAAALVTELLPAARQGLVGAGVAAEEADRLLGIIGARAVTGRTGAAWQRAALAAARRGQLTEQALPAMLEGYLSRAAPGRPVHTWPWPAETRHALLRRGEAR